MNTAITPTDIAVMHLQANDKFVGFSGNTYTVVSVFIDTTTTPLSVAVEFAHESTPEVSATMTFSNPHQSMRVIKK